VSAYATRSLVSLQTKWACTADFPLIFPQCFLHNCLQAVAFRAFAHNRKQSHTHIAAQFVTNLMVAGHVKSVSGNDDTFIQCFRSSDKWLRIRASPF